MKLDGREIPSTAFTFCPICAGSHNAVLTSDALWGAVIGHHVVTIDAIDNAGLAISIVHHYDVDGSRASLTGLAGHILLPDAYVAAEGTVIVEGSASDGRPRTDGIIGGVARGRFPTEIAVALGPNSGLSWKTQLIEQPGIWSLAAGQLRGHSYGVVNYRSEPPELELTLGTGSGDLPHGWIGASYILSDLARKVHAKGTLADILAVSELVTLEGEMDDRGRVNFGAILQHPYGWSVGIYRVNMGPFGAWRASVAYRFGLRL
jgi:hypothetical protein